MKRLIILYFLVVACEFSSKESTTILNTEVQKEILKDSTDQEIQLSKNDTIREFNFTDTLMFEVNRYKNGKKFGIHRLFDLNLSEYPRYTTFYNDKGKAWLMFPSADIDYSSKHGTLVKGIHLHQDSIWVACPFDSTQIWYEGFYTLCKRKVNPIGVHKIYYSTGELHWIVNYDSLPLLNGTLKYPISKVEYEKELESGT